MFMAIHSVMRNEAQVYPSILCTGRPWAIAREIRSWDLVDIATERSRLVALSVSAPVDCCHARNWEYSGHEFDAAELDEELEPDP